MTQKSIKIGDFLLRKKDIITVQDGEKYKRITIRMNKLGVLQRDEVIGVDIGTKKQYVVKGGEFIISKIDARNGAFGIVPQSLKGAIITGDFLAYDINTELVDMDFFLAFISLNNFEKICAQASSGTTNRQRLSEPKFLNFQIQIPGTTGEQKEVMKKYVEYKKGFSELKNLSEKNEKLIKSLKSSILQDAIQGKLVPQDPSDESVSILIEKIQAEKVKLIAEGKLKKQKPLPPIKPEEIPYELPKGWEWVKLGDIGITQTGTTPSTANPQYYGGELPFIKPGDISYNGINYNNESISVIGLPYARIIREDSLVMVCIGGSTGKCYFTNQKISCNQQLNAISGLSSISARFIYYFVSSVYFFSKVWELAKGSATPIVNKSEWENISFPLPPLQEQKRIVEKIDELMKSCELLDEQVRQAKERSEKLMESVLQGVFNG